MYAIVLPSASEPVAENEGFADGVYNDATPPGGVYDATGAIVE